MLTVSLYQARIRPPPVDDVNKLRHDWRCQRCFAPRVIHIRRNGLFTSPEYAVKPNEQLVTVSSTHYCAYTPVLSNW